MKKMAKNRYFKIIIASISVLAMLTSDAVLISAADGIFTGNGSNDENTSGAFQGYTTEEEIEGPEGFGIINVLEIVPDERMGFIGYTIGGCEPVGETAEEKAWIMDAMANDSAGSVYNSWQNPYFKRVFDAVTKSSDIPALTYERGYYTGYFKKVEKGKGFYALGSITPGNASGDDKITNVVMVSKFANPGNAESHAASYDYVWVESAKDSDGNYIQGDDVYTTKAELDEGKPIYVHNYKKTKYLNNEQFLTLVYPAEVKDGNTTYKADGQHGAYAIGDEKKAVGVYGDGTNLKAAELFKIATNANGNKGVKVFTRTPSQLQLDENKDLIDNVDLIVIAIEGDGTYDAAFDTYKKTYDGIRDNVNDARKKYSSTNDLSFEQALKIYNRVCKEDLALVCSHLCYTEIPNKEECNIWKLMYMLYLVNVEGQDQKGICGSGREFFKNFMPSYKDSTPVIAYARTGVNSPDGFKELKPCDFIRIDEKTGYITTDQTYDGGYYQKLPDGYGPEYIKWYFNDKTNGKQWPTSIYKDWLLGYSQGKEPIVDQWGNQRENYIGNDFFPLLYYLGKDPNWNNPKTKGKYLLKNETKLNMNDWPQYGQYRNQMLFNNQYSLFMVGNNGGVSMLKSVVDVIKPNKIIATSTKHTETVNKTAYMTMNIVNGDSVNKDIHGNKIMYVNQYEVNNSDPLKNIDHIPFDFEIRTTHPISKMVLKLKIGASEETIATYTFGSTSEDPLGDAPPADMSYSFEGGTGKLTKAPNDTTSNPPEKRNPAKPINPLNGTPVDDNVWKYTGTIKELKREKFKDVRNAKVIFEVESNFKVSGGLPLRAEDTITVVKREFFALQ